MKTQKRIIALVLFAVMLFSLAACSKNDPTPSTDNTTAPSTTPAGDATTPSTDASTSDWAGPDWMNQTGMPIVKEGTEKTLSIYVEQTAEYGDFKESWMYKYITEVMNINLDVTVFLSDSKADFLSLAFASNELPDIIIGSGFSTTELVNYGAVEGQLLDLNEYINDTYMPNLSGIFASNPNLKNQVMTPDGHIWGLGGISASRGSMPRYFMNYDYLEQLNIAVPTTLDEFIDAMRAIKAAGLCEYPIGGAFASEHPGAFILNAMGYVGANAKAYGICLRNGKVVMPLADRELFGEYLKIMNQLYEEGLIHPDFFTMDRTSIYAEFAKNQAFIMQAPFACTEDFDQYWAVAPLTSQWNSTPAATGNSIENPSIGVNGVLITSQCKEPELAAKFVDWFYSTTEDNAMMSMDGPSADQTDILLGVTGWKLDENGIRYYPEYEENKDKYTSSNDYIAKNISMWSSGLIGYLTWSFDLTSPQFAGEPDASAYPDPSVLRKDKNLLADGNKFYEFALQTVISPYVTNKVFPSISWMDADQASELAVTLKALRSYADPEIAKFITGARDLTDAELDDYFNQLEGLGSKEYVAAYQAYYDSLAKN